MKVVITDYQYKNIDQEKKIFSEAGIELCEYQVKAEDDVIKVVQDADAIVTQYSNISRKVIESLAHCKMIIKYGIGVNNIDSAAATERCIFVCNVPDYGVDEVSNHAISFLFALTKKLPQITEALKNGDWSYDSTVPLFRMQGQTLGLVGFGRIPQMVAQKMLGFGVRVLVFDPFVSEETMRSLGVQKAELNTLCTESDFVSIHCPLTEETQHLFNKAMFQKMKKSAFLINTSRGPVVNEQDLILALKNGDIAGAGLDVFENEPLAASSELLQMKNVLATPHCAWYSEESILALQRKVAEEVVNVLQ
ncbi:MAG: C-terminal binding protein, partial [Oscillospiraceae bacterium]